MAQLYEHIGFDVADEWYVVGEFHDGKAFNTMAQVLQ